MKNTFVISAHSFIDLVTNSSSEIFVCDTKMKEEAVKSILIELWEMFLRKESFKENNYYHDRDINDIFTDMIDVSTSLSDHAAYDDYDYSFKRGDIIIRSKQDNSIPYELCADIEHIFNAKRYHR